MLLAVIIIILIATSIGVFVICRNLSATLAAKRLAALSERIEENRTSVNGALSELSSKFTYSHYITESERVVLREKYSSLQQDLCDIINKKEFPKVENTETFVRLHKALSDTKGFKAINNQKFIEGQLEKHKDYFDTVLAYPLDEQQREAIVSLEDNVSWS